MWTLSTFERGLVGELSLLAARILENDPFQEQIARLFREAMLHLRRDVRTRESRCRGCDVVCTRLHLRPFKSVALGQASDLA